MHQNHRTPRSSLSLFIIIKMIRHIPTSYMPYATKTNAIISHVKYVY